MPLNYKDLAGQPIKPGGIVVYAALWSRSAMLKYGRVTRLCSRGGQYEGQGTVSPIRVVTVDRNRNDAWEIQKKGTEITLMFLDRMLVVPPALVPPEVFRLLIPRK